MAEEPMNEPVDLLAKHGITKEEAKALLDVVEGYYKTLDDFIADTIFKDEDDAPERVNRKALAGALGLLMSKAGLYAGYSKEQLGELLAKSFDVAFRMIAADLIDQATKEAPDGDAV